MRGGSHSRGLCGCLLDRCEGEDNVRCMRRVNYSLFFAETENLGNWHSLTTYSQLTVVLFPATTSSFSPHPPPYPRAFLLPLKLSYDTFLSTLSKHLIEKPFSPAFARGTPSIFGLDLHTCFSKIEGLQVFTFRSQIIYVLVHMLLLEYPRIQS